MYRHSDYYPGCPERQYWTERSEHICDDVGGYPVAWINEGFHSPSDMMRHMRERGMKFQGGEVNHEKST